jgi:dihydroxy-acid dehydratase
MIVIDAGRRRVDVEIGEAEIAERMRTWQAPPPRFTHGVLAKYARLVSSASIGAVTG